MPSRIPPKLRNRSHRLAIDLHLIPYYGKPTDIEANYVYRSQAKAGTTRFFAYTTVYTICRNKRVTLAIDAVPCTQTLVATLTYLLAIIHPLRMSIKLLCLDRGFYSVPIIGWLKALNFPFLMPAVIRGKTGGTRALLTGRKSYATDYTINSQKCGNRGFPCLVLSRIIREVSSRLRAAGAPFLTGNPSKGAPQVEHLFKTALNMAASPVK